MKVFVYVTIFDEGWPLELCWRGGYESWQSYYVLRNPDHQMVNRRGDALHHGVLSYAYPEARQYKIGTIDWLLTNYDWDGVFVCTRSQSRPAEYADQFGFNEPAIREFEERYGVDPSRSEFNLRDWRRLQGEYLTRLLREIKDYLRTKGLPLAVGIPRASYLGPPIGNVYLDWSRWISHGIVDYLVIDQVAAICPSTWTFLWPDSQGFGYVQNYLTGKGIPPMEEDLAQTWSPVIAPSNAGLYLARMWHPFDEEQHAGLSRNPAVDGLVFSSFHYDNPQVLSRGLWAM